MSRKRSIRELMDLRNAAAERAAKTGSQLAQMAAELANRYTSMASGSKSSLNAASKAEEYLEKGDAEMWQRINTKRIDRKYSENTYKGLNNG